MHTVNLADAKARLGKLIDRVQAGDTIAITRHGKAVACLVAVSGPRKRIDKAMLEALTAALPTQPADASEVVRSIRDSDRA